MIMPGNVWFSKWTGGAATVMSGPGWTLEVDGDCLVFSGDKPGPFHYAIEDTRLRGEHTVAVYTGGPTRIFLDGYEVWSAPVTVGDPVDADSSITLTEAAYEDVARAVRQGGSLPAALVEFAAMELNERDAARIGDLREWAVHARFRLRGKGQYGTVFAAQSQGKPTLTAFVNKEGIRVELPAAATRMECAGAWSDGRWHDLVIAFGGGAIEVFVDGWLTGHVPGSAPHFDRFMVGQSLHGERLMGEVSRGGIYPALNDQQIAALSGRACVFQNPVFDLFPNGIFHRIPSLLRHSSGRLVAFADARHGLPNDSPNVTEIVASFSDDEGNTWSDPQTIAGYPSNPEEPISVTDPACVEDAKGRIHLLFDLYPSGIGLLNSQPGHGHDGEDLLLQAKDGQEFLVPGGWPERPTPVMTRDGEPTEFVAEAGPQILGRGPLTVVPTGHIAIVTSSDRGETWSSPRLLTADVKDEWMTFLGIGPGAGIRLRHGDNAGRLLVPVYFSNEDASQFSAAVIYSDDDGKTWQRSGSTNDARTVEGKQVDPRRFTNPAATMSESAVVELPDGDVVMFSRSQRPFVQRAVSRDGGLTWGEVTEETQISEIFCQPAATAHEGFIYFANASRMLPYRGCGTLYRTDAQSLTRPDAKPNWISLAINPRHHGYQSIVALENGIGMLWERETAGVWFSFIPFSLFRPLNEDAQRHAQI